MSPMHWLCLGFVLVTGCCALGIPVDGERAGSDVRATLLAFHRAAATADFEGYFELLHEDSVFLGTDASERWPRAEFMEFARPHFQGDSAWIFEPTRQYVTLGAGGDFAWFEEELHSESYGECRGTGVHRQV